MESSKLIKLKLWESLRMCLPYTENVTVSSVDVSHLFDELICKC